MPIGPNGRKRPADVIGNVVLNAAITTGEVEEAGYTLPGGANKERAKMRARAMSWPALEWSAIAQKAFVGRSG